jgi:hypothetical protein
MDEIRFKEACERALDSSYARDSIGLLREKTLHAVLKDYFEPDRDYHEVKLGTHYADIFRDGCVTEIQTRSLDRLREKLRALLPLYRVKVVYPIPATKYLIWMDPESGALAPARKVPKRGSFYDAGRELSRILELLGHPNLTVQLLLIDMEEYRLRNGRSKDKKRGSARYDRIPLALRDELILSSAETYVSLFPQNLPPCFTAKEFRSATKCGPRVAPALLKVLLQQGIICREGKAGKAYLYKKV